MRRHWTSRFRGTPRSVWFAFGAGVLGCLTAAGAILFPVLGLIGSAVSVAPFVPMPWLQIVVAVFAGYLLAAGLLALTAFSRNGAIAWILAVAAVIATVIVSVYPAVAVAFTVVGRAGDVIPFIIDWIGQARSAFGV